jgi:hypothetical protein
MCACLPRASLTDAIARLLEASQVYFSNNAAPYGPDLASMPYNITVTSSVEHVQREQPFNIAVNAVIRARRAA